MSLRRLAGRGVECVELDGVGASSGGRPVGNGWWGARGINGGDFKRERRSPICLEEQILEVESVMIWDELKQ